MSPAVPRLRHVVPVGPVTRASEPVPVVALITWHDGRCTQEDGEAIAWTRWQVLIAWTTPWGSPHEVWVPAEHVQRRTEPESGTDGGPN
jgi:hypothetical protein